MISKFMNEYESIKGILLSRQKNFRLLIIDNHPLAVYAYIKLMEEYKINLVFDIYKAYNCEEALSLIKSSHDNPFDIILLDTNLPSSKDMIYLNGKDLGMKIRETSPNTKIVIFTTLNNAPTIKNIIKTIKPEGFMSKDEVIPENFCTTVIKVLQKETVYSPRISKLNLSNRTIPNHHLDALDIRILYFISIGEKTKNLPKYIPLSMPSIERRKKRMKNLFGISDQDNRQLIFSAKEKGFI